MQTDKIDPKAIVDAAFSLAEKTGRTKHIHISLSARFFAHAPEAVELIWEGYVEDVGRAGGLGAHREASLDEVTAELSAMCNGESYLKTANELEAKAAELRRLAGKAGVA